MCIGHTSTQPHAALLMPFCMLRRISAAAARHPLYRVAYATARKICTFCAVCCCCRCCPTRVLARVPCMLHWAVSCPSAALWDPRHHPCHECVAHVAHSVLMCITVEVSAVKRGVMPARLREDVLRLCELPRPVLYRAGAHCMHTGGEMSELGGQL